MRVLLLTLALALPACSESEPSTDAATTPAGATLSDPVAVTCTEHGTYLQPIGVVGDGMPMVEQCNDTNGSCAGPAPYVVLEADALNSDGSVATEAGTISGQCEDGIDVLMVRWLI